LKRTFYLSFLLLIAIFTEIYGGGSYTQIDSTCHGYIVDETTPNPFSPLLGVKVGIPDSSVITVEVHKILNSTQLDSSIESIKIDTILNKRLGEGLYLVNWNGFDSNGENQSKSEKYIFVVIIVRNTPTIYGKGYIRLEAKTKITAPM
jgi:hypothetical protein